MAFGREMAATRGLKATYYGIVMLFMLALMARVVIHLPPEVASENVVIRYVLAGQTFGGWVEPRAGVSSYDISTMAGGVPATGFKAVVYAPGCALQTIDIRPDGEYAFPCKPIRTIQLNGRLIQSEPLHRHGVNLQARYIARWAHTFLGLHDDSVLVIPLGGIANLSDDGRFQISVPDMFADPLAGAADEGGELQIAARDKNGGASQNLLALLIPEGKGLATRKGGLKIARQYPAEVVFAPCTVNRALLRDESGFAKRSDIDGCDRQNQR